MTHRRGRDGRTALPDRADGIYLVKDLTTGTAADPVFGLHVPESCPDVPQDVLNPKSTWNDKDAYDDMAQNLAQRFENNFGQFEGAVDDKVKAIAIRPAA